MKSYLTATKFINSDHPKIRAFAEKITNGSRAPIQKAVRIYYAVRDGWKYNPYNISLQDDALLASNILQKEDGHCIDKAVLMIALLRAAGVPARLCLAKVCNHIAAERMTEAFGTDELTPHGYVEVWLNERWVKATPAFNKELCEKLGVAPLDFDGQHDSVFQEFDRAGGQFMAYLEEYGCFDDVPLDFIYDNMKAHYPRFFTSDITFSKERLLEIVNAAPED
ncbi:MAG TPA: transglutaminase family protein [Saprospiraceae bacterium]|nr:transglutaminase family protein [Saprospiraceae bacterium]HMP12628.1 transglutaminase family protein [Saprospiraceae bacterium]